MRRRLLFMLPLLGVFLAFSSAPALASGGYRLIATVTIPGPKPLIGFDISWVDRSSQTYLLADRSNARVDIVDASAGVWTRAIGAGQFKGQQASNDISGPNGVLVVHDEHEVWAGDGDSTVKVFDFETGRLKANISTEGARRADEMAFDQKNHVLLVANDADDVPFVTFISTRHHSVLGHISFPRASNGLEQPVWDPVTHLFYMSVPELDGNPHTGAIAVMDPISMTLERMFPTSDCEPAGLALGPHQHLLLGCSGDAIAAGFAAKSVIIEARTGDVVTTVTQVGGSDEVWFNPGDKHYYLAANSNPGGPVLGVIDAETNTWIQNVPTFVRSHSVAANPINDHIFVPLRAGAPQCGVQKSQGCIGVYALVT